MAVKGWDIKKQYRYCSLNSEEILKYEEIAWESSW